MKSETKAGELAPKLNVGAVMELKDVEKLKQLAQIVHIGIENGSSAGLLASLAVTAEIKVSLSLSEDGCFDIAINPKNECDLDFTGKLSKLDDVFMAIDILTAPTDVVAFDFLKPIRK